MLLLGMCSLFQGPLFATDLHTLHSPDQQVSISFSLEKGVPTYQTFYQQEQLINPSILGFEFKNQPALTGNFVIESIDKTTVDEEWERPWGPTKLVRNNYRQLQVNLIETSHLERRITLVFRAFNDGVAFRYVLPKQPNLSKFAITSELTQFALADDFTAWSIPANFDSYELEYKQTPVSAVNSANTPITLKSTAGSYLSIHEAALTNYAGMTLQQGKAKTTLESNLVPWPDGIKVKGSTPFNSPWRTIQVAKNAAKLIESTLIVNLNEPSVIKDTSWIKPMKYIGIWWGMHMRKYTWEAGPKHGATTKNTKEYIDFASKNNINGVLVEGWNKGWETWHTDENIQDFTQPYDDFDIFEIVRYAHSKNVQLIGHHETGGNIPRYEAQLEDAFKFYYQAGVTAIKTGYAGKMSPEGTYHHGQYMVNHYRKVLELAAKYNIMVNAHEPIKATGISRTYPNMMTREAARGMEWNGWSAGNSPEHTVMLPFTRLLAGPVDYTPGIFNIKFDPQQQYRVNTTLAKQLAMFVNLYSPLQMASDMIENYENQPAFNFIKNSTADWDESIAINGEIGDFVTIARRTGKQWFIGAMTDESARQFDLELSMLNANTDYIAEIYSDAITTDYLENPTAIDIAKYRVTRNDIIKTTLANGGGQAVHIYPLTSKAETLLPNIRVFNRVADLKHGVFVNGGKFGGINHIDHLAVGKKITLGAPFDKSYTGGGHSSLIDGVLGNADYKTLWQGYRMKDIDAVIDLGEQKSTASIAIGFLQSSLHSILLPTQVTFSISVDGKTYRQVGEEFYNTREDLPDYQRKTFTVNFAKSQARYIKVVAKNMVALPSWHVRPGQETFIFADEIIVK